MRPLLMGLVLAAAAPGVAAAATPAVLPGWPVPGIEGELSPGPSAGVVEIRNPGVEEADVVARAADGRILWRNRSAVACGNCDSMGAPTRLQPDGTYGPLGATGDDYWAVDRRGARVAGCTGAVLADGTCVETLLGSYSGRGVVEMRALRGGERLWSYVEPDFDAQIDSVDTEYTVADGAGTAYVALPAGRTAAGAPAPARLIAVDAATGAFRWRVEGAFVLTAGLAAGVLVREGDALAAYSPQGRRTWELAGVPVDPPWTTEVDARRGRAYLGEGSPADVRGARSVIAIDTVTGRVVWRTRPADRATLLSVGPSGRVYVATERRGFPAVRAISPSGRGLWSRPVGGAATGAAETADGRVGLAAGGMTLLVDPERTARAPRALSVALAHRRVRECVGLRTSPFRASLSPGACPVLRVRAVAPTRLVVRISGRTAAPDPLRWQVSASPGTSWLRLEFAASLLGPGRHTVTVSRRGAARPLATFPLVVGRR